MALPSGYTKLEYIESTGTQYISTGITPTENTKVVIEFNSSTSSGVVFGQDSGYKVNAFMFAMTVVVFDSTKKDISISANTKHIVQVAPKAFKVDNGSSQYIYANKVNAAYPMFLFGNNRNGKFSEGVAMKLYSFKVYENDVLIADYIPCKQGNAVGLYDDVAGAMNLPLGTGDFTAGPSISGAHKTLVGGTAYTVKGGKCMVNGTVYSILKGRTLIGGTGYDITFEEAIGETWVLNEEPELRPLFGSNSFDIACMYDGSEWVRIEINGRGISLMEINFYTADGGMYSAYPIGPDASREITFLKPPTGDLLAWLQANAVKQ